MITVTERVAAGAALLDKKVPGWWREDHKHAIDLSRLDTHDCLRCVLGQLFGRYGAGRHELGMRSAADDRLTVKRGFFADDTSEYPQLDAEWRRAIAERRVAP
jgi:hypothetical protein